MLEMLGCSKAEMDDLIRFQLRNDLYEIQFAAMSMLSDAQEELTRDPAAANRAINRAKYLMDHVKTELRKL